MSSQELKKVATGKVAQRTDTFPSMLDAYKDQIAKALPKHLKPDTMLRIALTAFRMNPRLGDCHPASVFAAVVQAAQLGLRPNLLGECFLIPYKDQCQLQIGYQGLLELVRRSGLVEQISVNLVYTRDDFDVELGSNQAIKHKPYLDGDRGLPKLGYAIAKIKGGGVHVEIMTIEQINAIRDRSQNVINAKKYGKKTPWDTDWDEMARKTLARRICKWLPKSPELSIALQLSDAADKDQQHLTIEDAIDSTFAHIPEPEQEAEEVQEQADVASDKEGVKLSSDYYIGRLRAATSAVELKKLWAATKDAYKAAEQEIPIDVEAVFNEMRESLSEQN